MMKTASVASFLFLTVISFTTPSRADTKCTAGYLTQYGPNAQAVSIIRSKSRIEPIDLWIPLCPGDEIVLNKHLPDAFAVLDLRTGAKKLDKNQRKYTVSTAGSVVDSTYPFFRRLAKVIRFWAPPPYSNDSPNFMTRGPEDPIHVPVFSGSELKLISGLRTVSLVWMGGQPPFQLEISRGKKNIFHKKLNQTALPPSNIEFSTGPHTLTLFDAAGKITSYSIEVQDSLPVLPDHLVTSAMEKDFAAIIKAGWLSTVEDGVWRWEALIELLPYIRENPAAVALASALFNGDQL